MERKQGIRVHFNFGSHGAEDSGRLQEHKKRISHTLHTQPEGKVLVGIENPGISTSVAENAKDFTNAGIRPSVAFFMSVLTEKTGLSLQKLTDHLIDNPDDQTDMIKNVYGDFTAAEFAVLDELFLLHPSRVGMLIEGEDAQDEISEAPDMSLSEIYEIVVGERDMDKAVVALKDYVGKWSIYQKGREDRIAADIEHEIENDPEIISFEGTYGAAHTPIAHRLNKVGYQVSYTIDDNDENGPIGDGYYFMPVAAALRHANTKELTEHIWNQYLIAFTLYMNIMIRKDDSPSSNEIKNIYGVVKRLFPTMETVTNFNNNVRTKGFNNALLEMIEE